MRIAPWLRERIAIRTEKSGNPDSLNFSAEYASCDGHFALALNTVELSEILYPEYIEDNNHHIESFAYGMDVCGW